MSHTDQSLSENELQHCVEALRKMAKSPESCLRPGASEKLVIDAAAYLLRQVKAARKKEERQRDDELIAATEVRRKRTQKEYGKYFVAESEPTEMVGMLLGHRRFCYVCKQPYERLHHFYDCLCPRCGDFNQAKRQQTADLSSRTFVVTGGRIKIGFQIALKLLRAGAHVIATTRFAHDAAFRFTSEDDSPAWINRLQIHSADFRSLPSVQRMCDQIQKEHNSIDGLINNAAQTIRRPSQYFRHLIERERDLQIGLSDEAKQAIASTGCDSSPIELISVDSRHAASCHDGIAFPMGQFDSDGQQVDARTENSWTTPLSGVAPAELLEVHAVNSLVPFLLIQYLESLLESCPRPDRYIVNVSAMEGQLNTHSKSHRHPHTNMAKAGMNMITRTCAAEYAQRGIYMNSVDTGWVTNEFPLHRTNEMREEGFEPPLDEIDGAARVLDPLFTGVNEEQKLFGKFLKDYREIAW